jgi:ABC-type Fe3+-hydroxamate transport system substrate-binding protein
VAIRVTDDMGRELVLLRPPRRIVSLVPSETETLFALGLGDRVVGRTRYCEEPADRVAAIPVVGGTKDVDPEAVLELAPDLILANQEENSRPPLEKLAGERAPLFVAFPQRVAEGVAHVARIARMLGVSREPAVTGLLRDAYRAVSAAESAIAGRDPVAVFAPIWIDPLMTIAERTIGSDMLRLAGAANVFADRERRYPLSADLGLSSPIAADRAAARDRRYPRVTAGEVAGRAPAAVLLPNEPYAFADADVPVFEAMVDPTPQVRLISGRDLFWYGARTAAALARLTAVIDALR